MSSIATGIPRLATASTPRLLTAVRLTAAVLTAAGLASTLRYGLDQPLHALVYGLFIVVGELIRTPLAGDRWATPLGTASALAYALLGEHGGQPTTHGVLQVIALVFTATLIGSLPHVARGAPGIQQHLIRRVLAVAFAATCFQPLYNTGQLHEWLGEGSAYAVFIALVMTLTALCDAVLAAALAQARTGWRYGPLLRDELRALRGIGAAMCATGAVMALASAVAGSWALPVFCLPLLLTQLSFRRYAAIRGTYRQTIASLARATEIAGYTAQGHARRVAELSRAAGRELGLREAELDVLEQAALMHDIGQLSLLDPVPAGATEPLPLVDQRRIARLGGAVVRQTGVDAEVAVIVERQAEPYRDQALAARIVRAANAYDELAYGAQPVGNRLEGPLRALEQLRLATAEAYDPQVVAALHRALAAQAATRR